MNRVAIGVVVMVAGLSGCAGQAKIIQKGPDAGVVAIPENTNVWPTHYRDAAEALIKQHIGPSYMIVEEREVVTGGNNTAGPTASTTPASKEYRITYQKKPIQQGNPLGGQMPIGARPSLSGAGLGAGLPPAAYAPGGLTSPGPMSSGGMMNGSVVPQVGPPPVTTAGGPYSYTAPGGRPFGQ
jgi:hypothetical protein